MGEAESRRAQAVQPAALKGKPSAAPRPSPLPSKIPAYLGGPIMEYSPDEDRDRTGPA